VRLTKISLILVTLAASIGASGCGRTDLGRSPAQVVVDVLEAASGNDPDEFSQTLLSDVMTEGSIFNDYGRVQLRLILRDPGTLSPTTPGPVNGVTFTRYRVSYRRSDGRNVPGVDVPYGFDSAMTITVPPVGTAIGVFDIVRHIAKAEAPLRGLTTSGVVISTIADVTFYGEDLAGNDVVAAGSIGISFGNFADPE
jgi:hypothetical protein